MFFSDAVFAIAITLLVVEIDVPHVRAGAGASRTALHELWVRGPSFAGFLVSFLVIGAFWAIHHRAFGLLARHDPSFVWPNLQLLLAIAFLPFSTAFMSANVGQLVPHVFYLCTLLLAALLQVRLVRRVANVRFARPDVSASALAMLRRRVWALPCAVGSALLLAAFVPVISNLALASVPSFIWMLTGRRSPFPRQAPD